MLTSFKALLKDLGPGGVLIIAGFIVLVNLVAAAAIVSEHARKARMEKERAEADRDAEQARVKANELELKASAYRAEREKTETEAERLKAEAAKKRAEEAAERRRIAEAETASKRAEADRAQALAAAKVLEDKRRQEDEAKTQAANERSIFRAGVPQMLAELQSSYEQARHALDAGENDKTATLVQAALVTCSRIQERLPDSPEAKKADEWAAKLKPLARTADNAAKVARIEDQARRRLAVIRNLVRERDTASLERNSDTVETLTVLLRQNIDKLIKEYPHTKAAKEAKDLRP